jgi:hypothetical protein
MLYVIKTHNVIIGPFEIKKEKEKNESQGCGSMAEHLARLCKTLGSILSTEGEKTF